MDDTAVCNCVNCCFDGQTSPLIVVHRNTIIYNLVVVYWVKWTSSAGFRLGDSGGWGAVCLGGGSVSSAGC